MSISYFVVFGGYLAFLTWTCLKSMKEVESLSDFTTGGHRMGLLLGIGTSVATWVSVASVMGVPGQLYRTGVAAIIGWVAGWFLATAVMPILAYKVRRPELPARTFPEFIRMRFEPFERISGLQLIVAALMLVAISSSAICRSSVSASSSTRSPASSMNMPSSPSWSCWH